MKESLETRMMEKVAKNATTGCWDWLGGATSLNGYGVTRDGSSRQTVAHRVMYELKRGPIPVGLQIDHLCRNRKCVNPDHLEVVTQEENLRRGRLAGPRRKWRWRQLKTHCKRGHEFTPDNTINKADEKGKWRVCIACGKLHDQARDRRKHKTAETTWGPFALNQGM